jgi:pyridoxamine 5'-phosphate oxidase
MTADPFARFRTLADLAREAGEPDPTAHVLATASVRGAPSARYVLLKGVDSRGFVFFTNYRSRKARELEANPRAAVTFSWPHIATEVRAQGTVERATAEESDAYFASRPRWSQLGAWASRQSMSLPWRPWLIVRGLGFALRFFGRPVRRPPFWGGFRLRPDAIEFVRHDGALIECESYRRAGEGWRAAIAFDWA